MNKEYLLSKGFKLNSYMEGTFYEFITSDANIIVTILMDDYMGDEEEVIIQMRENFRNKIICIDGNVWELTTKELEDILSRL